MMCTSLLSEFGSSSERMERALNDFKKGKGILLVDDENRENEGDIIYPAETIDTAGVAMMIRECSGIVCLCLKEDKLDQLELPQMVEKNTNNNRTAFTVSIEAGSGVTTGVSAADRLTTIQTAISDDCAPEDLNRPGHVFPLRARQDGVFERRGHTEGSVDLARLAGFKPAGVLCELTNPDGTMSRLPEVCAFAKKNDMTVITIEDIVQYRLNAGEKPAAEALCAVK